MVSDKAHGVIGSRPFRDPRRDPPVRSPREAAAEPGEPRLRFSLPSSRPAIFLPGDPSPDLLTEQEAIRYLRLDCINIKNPGETLRRYRAEGLLRGTQVSKSVYYLRSELDTFLRKATDTNPR